MHLESYNIDFGKYETYHIYCYCLKIIPLANSYFKIPLRFVSHKLPLGLVKSNKTVF